jgi:ABC-type sugar transport system ATPase subunit
MGNSGLVYKNIEKSFGSVVAIKRADMEVAKGEVRAILGGNGSGKSTLAKVTSGIAGRDNGSITFGNKEIDFASPRVAKDAGVIMTSQELSLFNNLTVEENISVCNPPSKKTGARDKKEIKKRAETILSEMGLSHLVGVKVAVLPPNQQYMVEFAKALVQNPQILIIDEITSALYREDVEIVYKIIKRLKENGCVILFISHRMHELYAICDSVTVMRNGETIGTYPMQSKTEDELLSLMVGHEIVSYHNEGKHGETSVSEEGIFIRADHVPIKSYDNTVSLSISKGEIIGIAGLQGHGQSDLVSALYALHGPIKLEINGVKQTIHHPKDAVRHGFAFISGDREGDGVFNERNILENVSVVKTLVKHQPITNIEAMMDSYNIVYSDTKQLITSLSGGNQQKVVVARWLDTKPCLLLADDPTKGIDVNARTDLHKALAELVGKGNAVVMVSSDDDELVNIASVVEKSRVLVMYEGKIITTLTGTDITREKISTAAMSGKGDSQ